MDYTTGTQTIWHDDGSITTINVDHEPPMEPMNMKQLIAITGVTVGLSLAPIAIGSGVAWMLERRQDKKRLDFNQKRNREIFISLPVN